MRRLPRVASIALAIGILAGVVGVVAGCAGAPPAPEVSSPPLSFDAGVDANYGIDMVQCLNDKGWPATVGPDRSVRIENVPEDQQIVYNDEYDACSRDLGFADPVPTLTESQLSELYLHVLWANQCLLDAGYAPDAPPSEQAFIDGYGSNGFVWTPHDSAGVGMGPEDLQRMFEACPNALQR